MPKPPMALIVAIVLTYAWAFAWAIAEACNKDLPGIMIGGLPAFIVYTYIGGGIMLGSAIAAFLSWYMSKKEEALKVPKEGES